MYWYNDTSNSYSGGFPFDSTNGGSSYSPIAGGDDQTFKIASGSANFIYTYNSVNSTTYTTYPAGQSITIDGGVAGKLTFVPSSTQPSSTTESDSVMVLQ